MCRNITILHGLDPGATPTEVHDAALQYVRKISGMRSPSPANQAAFDDAVGRIAAATADLLGTLAPRRNPPPTVPPMRRRAMLAAGVAVPPSPASRRRTASGG